MTQLNLFNIRMNDMPINNFNARQGPRKMHFKLLRSSRSGKTAAAKRGSPPP
jgi:hypothetical protein